MNKMWNYITTGGRRRLMFVAVNAVIFFFLILMAGSYLKIKSYVETDSGFCISCHQTREAYSLWTRSEHQNVACQQCHKEDQNHSMNMLTGFMFKNKLPGGKFEPKGHSGKVDVQTCLNCHIENDQSWPAIDASIGHKVHFKKAGINCLKCHSRSMHSFKDASESCLDCHKERKFLRGGMERLHCLSCHNFLNDNASMLPDRATCLDCHQAKGLMKASIPEDAPMAKFPCWTCHHPHKEEPVAIVACTSCHKQITESGFHKVKAHNNCIKCHEAHGWKPLLGNCLSCHENKMNHNKGQNCWECHSFKKDKQI